MTSLNHQLAAIQARNARTELLEDIFYCGVMSFLGMLPLAAIIMIAWQLL